MQLGYKNMDIVSYGRSEGGRTLAYEKTNPEPRSLFSVIGQSFKTIGKSITDFENRLVAPFHATIKEMIPPSKYQAISERYAEFEKSVEETRAYSRGYRAPSISE
jgi:hypothetical protein